MATNAIPKYEKFENQEKPEKIKSEITNCKLLSNFSNNN